MALSLTNETALNLTLQGSVGSFRVGSGTENQNSLEVKYFLTHVGLNFASGIDEAVLSHMAPVRELFDFASLEFDEIMQRDIDDARVSSELVPYLLDTNSRDLIKLFPPIVVIVLPVLDQANRPDRRYPTIHKYIKKEQDTSHDTYVLRAGEIGSEVFQFEQPITSPDSAPRHHDLVRLRLNTSKTRLVIVDGQHRAMALLALYRNLKDQWSDERRAPFREYYAEWTPAYIQRFNLDDINMPVMFCTIPSLDECYSGDADLKMAARQIFLTLNKTARKVSNSRNTLLDDNDLIAHLLRICLSEVKRKDNLSPYALRIFNIELDQFEDRLKVTTPIALTGVNHVYYMIEHLMLNQRHGDVKGSSPRSGKFYKREDLNTYGLMERLNGRNLLGTQAADEARRSAVEAQASQKLGESFDKRYGRYIVSTFEQFEPFNRHCRAVLKLEEDLERNEDRKLRPILFDGQGISRVFEAHRQNLQRKLNNNEFETDVPKIQELKRTLDGTAKRLDSAINGFKLDRAKWYLEQVKEKTTLLQANGDQHTPVAKFIHWLYDNVYTTVAFQTALVCTFFGELERASTGPSAGGHDNESVVERHFGDYLHLLNGFFVPATTAQFKLLIRLFRGKPVGKVSEWNIAESRSTFKRVVFPGEMQPDQWPKYKYLILEVWQPEGDESEELKASVRGERRVCRTQIFKGLHERCQNEYLFQHTLNESELEQKDREKIFNVARKDFEGFLNIFREIDDRPSEEDMRVMLGPTESVTVSDDEDDEEW